MDTNVLYERMKALQAKEAGENTAIVEAAIEKDQAIVAGIRGDAAERPTPERTCARRRAPHAWYCTTRVKPSSHQPRERNSKSTHQFLPVVRSDPLLLQKNKKYYSVCAYDLRARAQPARSTRSSSTS